jgi:multidrug resistance efflux pump
MCKLAGGYLKSHQLRQFGLQQQIWQRLQQFVGEVHQSLDLKRTVYAIANEGRRVIECDRCSVAVYRGRRCTIDAVSGLDSLERRADQVKRLARLVAAVVRGKQPLWYDGDDSDLPPQIESILHDYLDLAHAKMLAIIPLRRTRDVAAEAAATRRRERLPDPPVLGALVIEQLVDASRPPALVKRVETVAEHASFALSNSVDHNSIFLAPLWRTIGKSRVLVTARNLPKTLAVAACILALIGALWLIPYPFTLGASGHLTPVDRQEIFAQVDGILEEISVPDDPAAIVEQGHVLARMTNIDLQSEVESLQGRLNTKREQINRLNRAINSSGDLSRVERIELEGELSAAESEAASLQVELQIKQRQLEHLVVTAPQRGHVVNWQVRQNLLRRPVKSGQNLMTLVDPNSEWQLELEVPERRVAHLLRAAEAEGQPLQVTFTLASHPGRQFQGTVLEIDKKLDVRSDQGNVALVRVDLDETRLPPELLRTGTRVTAKVHAGRRKLGYVWFRELLETIQTYWQYWF